MNVFDVTVRKGIRKPEQLAIMLHLNLCWHCYVVTLKTLSMRKKSVTRRPIRSRKAFKRGLPKAPKYQTIGGEKGDGES